MIGARPSSSAPRGRAAPPPRLAEVGDPVNAAVKLLYAGVETTRVHVDAEVIADFDTVEELDRIRARFDSEL